MGSCLIKDLLLELFSARTSEATDRFIAGEPGSSGRLDARGAGSSVTVAAKGSGSVLGSRCARYSEWSYFGVGWIKSSVEARNSKCAPEGDIRRCPTKVSEVEVHRRHGPGGKTSLLTSEALIEARASIVSLTLAKSVSVCLDLRVRSPAPVAAAKYLVEVLSRVSTLAKGEIKAKRQSTYNQQYQLFVQAPGESIEAMFSRFDAIVGNLRSNGTLAYNDHDRAIKLLYALDRSIWEVKISSIEESAGYDTLTCDELFSKLKSTEIAKASLAVHRSSLPQPLALVSSTSRGTTSEPSTSGTCVLADGFALSSLVSVTKE
ncbi:hypothetical protein GUJ93_ZPchr0015g6850 [Zizania palustris]|uniref:Uncharacterized protein n=1 Tax=Zizania palustris TaxID=103762 RepID=A0A8J5TD88_ZIZPA|nr:hypothetical protein GUJ93_ZPchr0015g6850 [Zizania palustris]